MDLLEVIESFNNFLYGILLVPTAMAIVVECSVTSFQPAKNLATSSSRSISIASRYIAA